MKGQHLRQGMQIKFSGQRYSIEKRLDDGELQLKHLATETLSSKPEAEIVKALFAGVAELLGANGEVENLQARRQWSSINDFEALAESDPCKRQAVRKLKYIEETRKARLVDFGKNARNLKPIIERVGKAIRDPRTPSCMTVSRWHKAYTEAGDDIRVLPPAYKARGHSKHSDRRRISENTQTCQAVDKIIRDVIHEHYLQMTRPTAQTTYDLIKARIARENHFRDAYDQLPVPHRNTLYRKINELDPYEKDKARLGKRIADLRHKVNKQGVRPKRPLERVEIDDTKLDLFVIDEKTRLPIGRPWLMVAICTFTKMILGYYLSFFRPSYLSVMQTLLHSIRPKDYVRERYPEIVHSWDTYGLPDRVVVDNAKQYYSASFDEACLQLGIITQYAPVKHPYYKPSIERVFGTINTRLLHQMPGTTFASVAKKWDYDPKKNAIISIQSLDRIIHNYVVDVYHQDHHRGIDDVPARRWEIGTKNFPPALPFKAEELNVLLGHIEHRSVSSSGIEMWGLYYNDPCLSPIKSRTKKGEKVKVKYDPMNISLIHVYDQTSNQYLPVPAAAQEYAGGLSLWQHKVIKREARLAVEDYVDQEELDFAKERIQKIVDEQFTSRSKSASNVKAALWNMLGKSAGRLEVSEPGNDVPQDGNQRERARFVPDASRTEQSNAPTASELGIIELHSETRADSLPIQRSDKNEPGDANFGATGSVGLATEDISALAPETEVDSSEFETAYDLPRRK